MVKRRGERIELSTIERGRTEYLDRFSPEDREFIIEHDGSDGDVTMYLFSECFEIKPAGFNVREHECFTQQQKRG